MPSLDHAKNLMVRFHINNPSQFPRCGAYIAFYVCATLIPSDADMKGNVGATRCAEHVRQLRGESPLPNLMEVKG